MSIPVGTWVTLSQKHPLKGGFVLPNPARNLLVLLLACVALGLAHGTEKSQNEQKADSGSLSGAERTRPGNASGKPGYKEGELLVKFKEGTTRYQAEHVTYAKQMAVSRRYKNLSRRSRGRFALVKSQASTQKMLQDLRESPHVEAASPNYIRHMAAAPNDTRYSELWGLNRIEAPNAWETATNASKFIIANIDSGVDHTHQDLEANMWHNPDESLNGTDDDGNGYVDDIHGINAIADNGAPMDNDGHGTHTAGISGAVGNNDQLVTGVNWEVRIMALKFLNIEGSGTIANAIECMDYVIEQKEEGENIVAINASWGGGGRSDVVRDVIAQLGDLGIIFCAAAGNAGMDLDKGPFYPASYDLDNILAVAATNQEDNLASFSNYGLATVNLGAPGTRILSTLPGGGYKPSQSGDIFFDDMESGEGKWTHYGSEDSWKITEEQKTTAPSGNHTWSDSNDTKYSNDTNASLEADQTVDLSPQTGENIAIGSQLKYALEHPYDKLWLEISNDNGTSWSPLWSFTQSSSFWSLRAFYLPETSKNNAFRFRFRLQTDESITKEGVYIDDVGLGTGSGSNATGKYCGTSMATPFVTGAVALMAAAHPQESMLTRKHRILAGVDHVDDLEEKVFQEGRLNLSNSISTVPKACSHDISPTSLSFEAEGGQKDVSIDGRYSDCNWSASSNLSWASVSPRTGKGNGLVTVSVKSNSQSSSREGTVPIAGNELEITQSASSGSGGGGGCIYNPKSSLSLSPFIIVLLLTIVYRSIGKYKQLSNRG